MKWPDETREHQKNHALRHVHLLDKTLKLCDARRTAVQAGGNVGLWPLRMATVFKRVITFEPEPFTRECLVENVRKMKNIEVRPQALGAAAGLVDIERRSLGSHRIIPGEKINIMTLDELQLHDLDLLQLDVEGYEFSALVGAQRTIKRCRPIIHVEILDPTNQQVPTLLERWGYRRQWQAANDHVFAS